MNPDQPVHVLIAEDDASIQLLLRHFLKKRFDLVLTTTIDEALAAGREAAQQRPFDLLLLDINMGEDRTGVDLLQTFRQMPAYRATPAVACTAYALDGDRERFLSMGFDEHIDKPFSRDRLLRIVQHVLQTPVLE